MGLPQRIDEYLPEQRPDNVRAINRDKVPEVAGGTLGRLWLYIVVALAIVCVVWIAWGVQRNGPQRLDKRTAPAVVPADNDVAVLSATEKQPYAGQPFHGKSIPVRYQVNEHVLWVGENNSIPMLVVLNGAASAENANFPNGHRINITGTVQMAPPPERAKRNWALGIDDADLLEREGAYIQATQVTPAPRQQNEQ